MRNFALEVHFSRWEFAARHHMTASDLESRSVDDLLDLAGGDTRERFGRLHLGYTETWGAPSLREAIAGTYEACKAADVLCFAGAEEGLYAAMRVLMKPGDHAIVVVPNYQAAESVVLEIGTATGVAMDPENGWRVDPDAIEAAIRPETKLVSINYPNNPTGAVMPREDFDRVVAICRHYGLWLFCDEVYRLIEIDEARRLPQAADVYERGLSLNVMSKAYGLPGLRVGWIACRDRELLARLERYKHYLSICNSAPSEFLAEAALGVRDTILAENRALVRANLNELEAFMVRHPGLFEWQRPDGGCIAFPRYLGADGAEAFCRELVEQAGVLLLPASVYRSDLCEAPADRFRIGFGRKGIAGGIAAMETFIGRNLKAVSSPF